MWENSPSAGGHAYKMAPALWETLRQVLKKSNTPLLYDLVIPPLHLPKGTENFHPYRDLYINILGGFMCDPYIGHYLNVYQQVTKRTNCDICTLSSKKERAIDAPHATGESQNQ